MEGPIGVYQGEMGVQENFFDNYCPVDRALQLLFSACMPERPRTPFVYKRDNLTVVKVTL